MEIKLERFASLPCVPLHLSSPFQKNALMLSSRLGQFGTGRCSGNLKVHAVKPCQSISGKLTAVNMSLRTSCIPFATSGSQEAEIRTELNGVEQERQVVSDRESVAGGKPGFTSFYHQSKSHHQALTPRTQREENFLLWFGGSTVFVASFVFPSLYLRRIISTIFEDSLLTDFLILFFTEVLFYCGVAIFFLVIHRLNRPSGIGSPARKHLNPHLGYRISSVAVLALSVIVPTVTMGLVWPWTGPAASAALAPYLVGIIVQFAFEQFTRRAGSPSSNAIPIIFQVYRLHQLNRATQLVTALSFTVRAAESTPQNLAINGSLTTLISVLQFLGIVCIWSLSSFVMRYFSSDPSISRDH